MKLFINLKRKFLSLPLVLKIILLLFLVGIIWFTISKTNSTKDSTPSYKTTTAQISNIISTVSATGSITSGNNTNIYTTASGEVLDVYVKNGDTVRQGQKIAQIKLDQDGQKKQATAWATYLSAKNSLLSSQQNKLVLENGIETAKRTLAAAQDAVDKINDYTKSDLEKDNINSALVVAKRAYDIALQKYQTADSTIAASQSQVSSAWYTYQQSSATIYAPSNGVISNFTLTKGMSIANLSTDSSSSSNNTTQSVGIITNPNNKTTASVSLTEIDVTKVFPGQKATLTLDAFPTKTFTGEVLAIDTNGQSTSGVVSYPAIIVFDTSLPNIYPNMSVSASILIDSKQDVLIIPSSSIQTSDGISTVKVIKDSQTNQIEVETGLSDDTNTEIISGLSVGDTVITSTVTNNSSSKTNSSTNQSVFGGSGFGGGMMRR